MATQVFLRNTDCDIHRAERTATLAGSTAVPWKAKGTSTSRGAASTDGGGTTATVTGPTTPLEVNPGAAGALEWITPPIDQDVTISGTITCNIWMAESNMAANVGVVVNIQRINSQGGIGFTLFSGARGLEVAVTTPAVNNYSGAASSVAFVKGDRIRIRVLGGEAGGTMASGNTFTFKYDGPTGGADGDSFITFTETFGFQTTDPTGSQVFLTDVASPVSVGTVEREAWTSRGNGVDTDVTNTAAGPLVPGVQVTDTAGGTAVEWYTRELQPFTLSGVAKVNIRGLISSTSLRASPRCEIAVCNSDGSGAVVWGSSAPKGGDSVAFFQAYLTTESVFAGYVSGIDTAVTANQRLRIRVYNDDGAANQVSGGTITTHYDGTSAAASGDTYVILEQTVLEVAAAVAEQPPVIPHRFHNGLIMRGRR